MSTIPGQALSSEDVAQHMTDFTVLLWAFVWLEFGGAFEEDVFMVLLLNWVFVSWETAWCWLGGEERESGELGGGEKCDQVIFRLVSFDNEKYNKML